MKSNILFIGSSYTCTLNLKVIQLHRTINKVSLKKNKNKKPKLNNNLESSTIQDFPTNIYHCLSDGDVSVLIAFYSYLNLLNSDSGKTLNYIHKITS